MGIGKLHKKFFCMLYYVHIRRKFFVSRNTMHMYSLELEFWEMKRLYGSLVSICVYVVMVGAVCYFSHKNLHKWRE